MPAAGKVSLVAAAALLLGLSLYIHFTIGFWGDQDWELLVARMLLDGKKLYIDHFPVNPPLIFILYTLPAALAEHIGCRDYQALVALWSCVIVGVVALCTRLIAAHPAFSSNPARRMEFAVLLGFLFVFRIASSYFGDREHIFLILTFPYLLRWMPSLSAIPFSARTRVLTGSLAALGFLIKPHCMLFFVGIQVISLLRKDRPRIFGSLENRIIYVATLLYLLGIALFTPEYFSAVVPMALLTYSAISAGPKHTVDFMMLVTLAMTFIMFRPRFTSPYRNDIYYLLWGALILLGYAFINNGWDYSYQPLITLLLFINGFVLWEFVYLKRHSGRASAWPFNVGVAFCLLNFAGKAGVRLLYFYMVFTHPCHGDAQCPGYYQPFTQEIRTHSQTHSFGMIGMNFPLWTRVSKLTGAEWVTRFPQLWMIPKFISNEDFSNAHQWILYYVAGALTSDLEKNRPEIVFVDKSESIYTIRLKKPYDWIAAFSTFVNFKEAWEHYAFVHTIDACDAPDPTQEVGLAMSKSNAVPVSNCRFDVYRRLP